MKNFKHSQYLSALGKSVIKSLINFEPVLKGDLFFSTHAQKCSGKPGDQSHIRYPRSFGPVITLVRVNYKDFCHRKNAYLSQCKNVFLHM